MTMMSPNVKYCKPSFWTFFPKRRVFVHHERTLEACIYTYSCWTTNTKSEGQSEIFKEESILELRTAAHTRRHTGWNRHNVHILAQFSTCVGNFADILSLNHSPSQVDDIWRWCLSSGLSDKKSLVRKKKRTRLSTRNHPPTMKQHQTSKTKSN